MSYPVAYVVQSLDDTCGVWIDEFEYKVEIEPETTYLWLFKSKPLPTNDAIVAARKKAFFKATKDKGQQKRILEIRRFGADIIWSDMFGWSMGEI